MRRRNILEAANEGTTTIKRFGVATHVQMRRRNILELKMNVNDNERFGVTGTCTDAKHFRGCKYGQPQL